jgi:hypothetical protein
MNLRLSYKRLRIKFKMDLKDSYWRKLGLVSLTIFIVKREERRTIMTSLKRIFSKSMSKLPKHVLCLLKKKKKSKTKKI